MAMPRVALVVPGFEHFGGVGAVALFLHRILRDSGRYRPEFVSLAMASDDPSSVRLRAPGTWLRGVGTRTEEWLGHRVCRVGTFGAELEFQRFRPRRALTSLLRSYDLVQIVAGSPCWGLVARGVGRPVALQVASPVAEERRELLRLQGGATGTWRRWMTRLTATLEPAGLRAVDAVFVENRWMEQRMRERVDPSRVVFAPPGVDTDRFRPGPAAPAPGFVLSVGRFSDRRKRVELLFRAYAAMRTRLDPAPSLLLVGSSPPLAPDWQLARELGIRDAIEFRQSLPDAELAELHRSALLFVQSSDEEGLGVAMLEAMASGVPVVSTDCEGPKTSVIDGRTGLLTPRGNAEALAAGMQRIASNPALRAEMAREARSHMEAHFSLRSSAAPFLAWYDAALEGRSAGRTSD